jgi:hypothetical protein
MKTQGKKIVFFWLGGYDRPKPRAKSTLAQSVAISVTASSDKSGNAA